MLYVVAKYQENVEWVKEYSHIIYDKSKDIPNEGREAETYLRFIIENYDKLEGDYVFCQGNPFDHQANFIEESIKRESPYMFGANFICNSDGSPHHTGLNIPEVWSKLITEPIPENIEFYPGAMFKLNAEHIYRHTKEYYQLAREISLTKDGPWILERLWSYIFTINN